MLKITDAPVIHMGNNNEVPMVHSDNFDGNIFTINVPSNFTYDHLLIKEDSVMVVT